MNDETEDFQFEVPMSDIEINEPRKDGIAEGIRGINTEPHDGFRKTRDALLDDENCSETTLDDSADETEQPHQNID